MQTRLAPLKNNNFEFALFSFWTLKTALQKQRNLCQLKVSVANSFSHLENLFLWTYMYIARVSFVKQLTALNKALACKTISTATLIVFLITYAHNWETSGTLSMPCHRTRACAFTFFPVFPWRVTNCLRPTPSPERFEDFVLLDFQFWGHLKIDL